MDSIANLIVAPFVGAWIEILNFRHHFEDFRSLPSWERGLKLHLYVQEDGSIGSLPSWERGLKYGG